MGVIYTNTFNQYTTLGDVNSEITEYSDKAVRIIHKPLGVSAYIPLCKT